jgi:hypothetical protein
MAVFLKMFWQPYKNPRCQKLSPYIQKAFRGKGCKSVHHFCFRNVFVFLCLTMYQKSVVRFPERKPWILLGAKGALKSQLISSSVMQKLLVN